jgi:AcrR family transcriptional regulator
MVRNCRPEIFTKPYSTVIVPPSENVNTGSKIVAQSAGGLGPEDGHESGEIVARGRGRPKLRSDQEQRDAIVRNALDLFVRDGYAATSMDDVAATCHISKRTLYRLFPRKIDLFAAMVEEHRHSMLVFPPHDLASPIEEQLARVFLVDIGAEAEHRRAAFIGMAVIEARHVPELANILRREGGDKSRALLGEWLAGAKRLGLIDVEDPDAAAGILMDMMFGAIALKTGQGAEWPGSKDRPSYMRQCIRYFVNGIRHR